MMFRLLRLYSAALGDVMVLVRPYALASLVIFLTTVALMPFRDGLATLDIALIFLTSVTVVSLFNAVWPSTIAAVIAFLCFDVFFIPPYYTFSVHATHHILALFAFLGIAVLTSQLLARIRRRTVEAIRRGRQTETLYDLSIALISEISLTDTLDAIVVRVREVFALDSCAILITGHERIVSAAVSGQPVDFQDRNLLAVARWVMDHRQSAGLDSARTRVRLPGPRGQPHKRTARDVSHRPYMLLLPIATSQRPLGVLLVSRDRSRGQFDDEQTQMLETFANQAAIAVERRLLTEEQTNTRILARSDELKSALLSAVSHDLRTPLASIKTSATSLLQLGIDLTDADRKELLTAIDEEVDRMNQLVTNLLDLSRIEAGAMRLDVDWYEPDDVIQTAIDRSDALLQQHRLLVDVPEDLPAIELDYVKIVQVLMNVLQNAAKYSPEGSDILLSARMDSEILRIDIRDEGVGIDPEHLDRIFDKFYRVEDPNRPLGAGIGLAICKGFVEAHGGRIWAERNPIRGTTVSFTLPVTEIREVDRIRHDVCEPVS